MTDSLLRGVAMPNFGDEPTGLIELGVAAEQAGFDGFFLWDHIVFSNTGDGPPIIDPWLVLAVVAVGRRADPDAEDHPPAAEPVQACDLPRKLPWPPSRHRGDHGAELDM